MCGGGKDTAILGKGTLWEMSGLEPAGVGLPTPTHRVYGKGGSWRVVEQFRTENFSLLQDIQRP